MRKEIGLRLGSAILAASMAAGCGNGASAAESQKPTNQPSSTPSPTEITLPTPKPTSSNEVVIVTPAPVETPELSQKQQAINTALDFWLNLLDSTQKVKGDNNFYLKTTITNKSDWEHNKQNITFGLESDSALVVTWVGGVAFPKASGSKLFQGVKSQGILDLEQISLSAAEVGLTDPDRQAGITKIFAVNLNFKTTFSENEFWPSADSSYGSLSKVESWLFTPESQSYQSNSPIREFTYKNMKVALQNGKWVFMGQQKFQNDVPSPDDPLANVLKPMPLMGNDPTCRTDGAFCRVYEVTNNL